jgi:hypothetical protein
MLKQLALVLVTVAACGKGKKNEKPPEPTTGAATKAVEPAKDKPAEPAPPIPKLTGLFNCHAADPNATNTATPLSKNAYALPFTLAGCPMIPPVYGKADLGMPAAEAGKAAKAKVDSGSGYIYVGKHPTRYQFAFHSDDAQNVDSFGFNVDEDGFAHMKAAWGEPLAYKALVSDELAWFNPTAKVKVTAAPDPWSRQDPKKRDYVEVPGYNVRFQRYTPLADVLGPEGIVQKPLIGAGVEEINKRFPGALEIKSEAQNKAEWDKLGLDEKSKKQMEALGAGGASANLKLPELETGAHHLLVQPDWKDAKIVSYSFTMSFGKGNDKVKGELLAQIVESLGAPLSVKQDEYNKERWVYEFKGAPGSKVQLQSDILGDGWTLEVAAAK